MKKNYLFRYVKFFAIYSMVFLWAAFKVNAQCPTVNDPSPTILDASGYTFADLSADYVTDNGGGISWYSNSTGGTFFSPTQLVSEGTYYADDNSGACGPRTAIIVDFQVNRSGQSLDGIYCSNENPTIQIYIDDVLQSNIPSGGWVEVYNDFELTDLANSTDPLSGFYNYFIIFVDSLGNKSQIEEGDTIVVDSPSDPDPQSTQIFCSDSNPTVTNLDSGTTSTFKWYQSADGFGNPIPPALSLSTPLVNGNTYYVIVDSSCDSNAMPVLVNINNPVNAGTSAALEYCDDSIPATPFDLFDELGGTPDTNGTWSGPLPTSNGNQGTVDISTLIAGIHTFTYTVPNNGACPQDSATITITIYKTLTSGTVSPTNPATFCESTASASFDLFSLLDNEDAGGQWTQGTLSSDPIVPNPSTINLTGFFPETYNFTYTQNISTPCPEESTTVQVVILPDPNAGIAENQRFCENDLTSNSPFDLFDALDGSQDNNSGTWTDANNATVADPLNLDITGFAVTGSPYNFTYTVDNGTCTDDETISITILPAPESGTPVATFPDYCEGSAPASFDLFTLLDDEDQTGTWYVGTDNLGATISNPVDMSTYTANTYNFTFDVDAIGTCDDALVTVSVTINPLPNTGTPIAAVFCENDLVANSPLDLFGQLTGEDAGGTWADDDTTGAIINGSDVDLTLLTIGSYNFTYTITDANTCANSSTVTVTVEDAPESGTPVATFPDYCEGSAPASFDLFTLLDDEDQTGTWHVGTDNLGATISNPVDLSTYTANTYNFTYDVDAIGSCDDVLVTVSVTINPLPNTGTPITAVFCENDLVANSPLDLFGQLTDEETGGTWTDDDTTGALGGSNVDLTLLTIGSYNFTYTITDANTCTNSSTVTVTVEDAPESGTVNVPVEFCLAAVTTGQTYNLFDLLTDEDQTGTWSDDDATGALTGNSVTLDGLAQGTYNFTYDVAAIGTCDDVNVTVSIIINDTVAPTAIATQAFCDTAIVADLVATGTTIQWYADATGGTPLAGTDALVNGEDYFASQTDATTSCESSVRTQVIATIYQSPNAGNPATPIIACNNTTIDLNSGLDGTQDIGGTWYEGPDNTGAVVASPTTYNISGFVVGNYQFTYYVTASAPCVDDSTIITVTIEAPLSAGTDNVLDVCSNNGTTDLFTLLGSADVGGTWSPALASGTGVFDPLVDTPGTYTYSLTNACGTVSSDVVVTVTQAPNAGTDNTASICVIDGVTDLFTFLGSSAQTGGTWSPALTSGTGAFDPLVDTAGVYTYTVTAIAPCSPDSSAQITVTLNDSPAPIVLDANPEFCLVDNPTVSDLDAAIRVTGTISWYADATLTRPLNATDTLVNGENYFARQTTGSGCESSQSVEITATVNNVATPTLIDSDLELCINDDPTIMELTVNISEYDSNLNNINWYDTATGGTPLSGSSSLSNGDTYYATLYDASTGCESSVRLAYTTDLTSCGELVLPDGFSPNGDGVNDTFDYNNLDILHPNFEIQIFNRYGTVVYKGNASTPRFDGTSNQGGIGKKQLPVGVYFYIFNFNDGTNKPKQGRLYLSR